MAFHLWEEEREKLKNKEKKEKPPLSTVAHFEDGYELQDNDLLSNQDGEKLVGLVSEDLIRKMLPDYVGECESESKIIPLPTQNIPINKPKKDVANLQALMSAPLTCTIPLVDLLKIRPNLWEKVVGFPKVGEFCKKHNIETNDTQKKPNAKKQKSVPINKASSQATENELGNTTLPVEFNDCKDIAILDTRIGVSIATNSMWQKWGKLAI